MGLITLPTTFVDGTIPTAAQFNGDFQAISNELNGNITNANISASAGISESKLAFNTTSGHTHDGVDSKAISGSADSVKVYNSGSVSINSATPTALTFSNEDHDTNTIHDPGSPTKLTIPTGKGGKWLVGASVVWESNTVGAREVAIRKNGSANTGGGNAVEASSNNPTTVSTTTIISLAAGDYIEAYVTQKSGGALNVIVNDSGSSGALTEFWAIGPLRS